MPYAEFFQLDNEEPPDCEDFLLAGLKYFRDVYGREPGQPRTSKDEEDYV
jgi:hypothetical protein